VVKDERDPPPMHFGDYPHDAYWSAERRDQDASYPRRTRSIRLMWDYGVRVLASCGSSACPANDSA